MVYKILIILLCALIIPTHVTAESAVNIKSTLLHGATHFQGNPRLSNTYFNTSIQIPYKSGKLILSSTPDGTGSVRFFNSMHIYGTYPSGGYFEYAGNCADREIPPINISKFITTGSSGDYLNISVGYRKEQCGHATKIDGVYHDYADVGNLYLIHFDDSEDIPTPFLRLPWDYEVAGLSFQDAALQINSYFDHEYPLLSSGLSEESFGSQNSIISFNNANRNFDLSYSSHDGYDWGSKAAAHLGDPVLAAAGGVATYSYGAARGNAILIDHGNGYQTRYYHLLPDGLTTKTSAQVTQGQQIGLVGSTGNSDGPHIHFMVIKDKNSDGNFEDNIPDGLVDPFGWQSFDPDPWVEYGGPPSFYLWGEKNSFQTSSTLGSSGKKVVVDNFTLDFPKNAVPIDTILEVQLQSPEQSENLYSIGNIIRATAEDGLEQQINTFNKLWNLLIKFNTIDIERFNPETLSIYSRTEGEDVWLMEETIIDFATGQAHTSVDHMTEFAFMGEKLDSIAPETTADIVGTSDVSGVYTNAVKLSLQSDDLPLEHSLGIAYTLYKLNDADWEKYNNIITVSEQGIYNLSYFSQDNDHNKEDAKTLTFTIDYSSLTPTSTLTPTQGQVTTPTPTPTQPPSLTPTPTTAPTSRQDALPSPALTHMKVRPSLTHPTNTPPQVLGVQDTNPQSENHFLSFLIKALGILISGSALGGGAWWKWRK